MSDVTSTSFAERAAAVSQVSAEAQAECTAAVAQLNNQIRACHDRAAKKRDEAARAAAAQLDALDAALAVDALAVLVPLAKEYPASPRETASKVAEAWRALSHRAQLELGTAIHCSHLAIAFANATGAADRFGASDSFHFDGSHFAADRADEADRAILGGGHNALIDSKLRELEIAVVDQAQRTAHADAERATAKHSRATAAGMRAEENRVDAKRVAARAEDPSTAPGTFIKTGARW